MTLKHKVVETNSCYGGKIKYQIEYSMKIDGDNVTITTKDNFEEYFNCYEIPLSVFKQFTQFVVDNKEKI